MKRIIFISWNRVIAICLLIVLILGFVFVREIFRKRAIITNSYGLNNSYKSYFEPDKAIEGSLEQIYQDVFMTLLLPHIQEAVDNYYETNTGYTPTVDPWDDILSIERPNGYRTFLFVIKLEVEPYLGAHNSIGVDHITLKVSPGEVKVEKFEHIKDYPIPPGYKN